MDASRKAGQCLLQSPQDISNLSEAVTAASLLHEKIDRLKVLIAYLEGEIEALESFANRNKEFMQCQVLKAVQKEVPIHMGDQLGTTHITAYEVVGILNLPKKVIDDAGTANLTIQVKSSP